MAAVKPTSRLLKKWSPELPYDPAVPLLAACAKELKALTHMLSMLMAALLTKDKRQKQLKCPSTHE